MAEPRSRTSGGKVAYHYRIRVAEESVQAEGFRSYQDRAMRKGAGTCGRLRT